MRWISYLFLFGAFVAFVISLLARYTSIIHITTRPASLLELVQVIVLFAIAAGVLAIKKN
jgi:hypothetical protein